MNNHRQYDPQPPIYVPGWQPSPQILAKAAKMLHQRQSAMGRWMDMGERADYLLANMPEINVGWEARLVSEKVDTVVIPKEEAA